VVDRHFSFPYFENCGDNFISRGDKKTGYVDKTGDEIM
jgi:hypothetical protein